METLPLELREQITSFLLPRANRKAITAAPFSSKAERTDIYNLRLTSHRINAGASQAFLKVIGDVPTKCTKSSLHSLANLVALEDVGKHITTLAFNTCALFLGEKKRYLNDIRFSAFERSLWITTTLGDELVKILRKTPRLRHLTYLRQEPEVRYHRVFGRESLDIAVILGRMQKPIEYIRKALETTTLALTLETLSLLNTISKDISALIYLNYTPTREELTNFRIPRGANLTSGSRKPESFPFGSGYVLRELIFSGRDQQHTTTEEVVNCVNLIIKSFGDFDRFTIRDMVVVTDIGYSVPQLLGNARFKELVFQDFKISFTDEITLSGPSEPRALDRSWKALPRFCERANVVLLKMGGVERVMERAEWEG